MENTEIKSSNDLLGFLIKIKDENNDCDLLKVLDVMGSNRSIDLQELINELSDKKFVKQMDTCTVHLYESGIDAYVSPLKKIFNILKKPVTYIFTYIMGILSAVIAQMIINMITQNTTP